MLHQELTQPQILGILAASGHGDNIAIVDSNYPAQGRRDRNVPLVNLNITHQVVPTPLLVGLVAQSIPIERCTIPVPKEGDASGARRPVHEAIMEATQTTNPDVEIAQVEPQEFYNLTSSPNLALMIVSGERSHFGSVILTVGYLPELR